LVIADTDLKPLLLSWSIFYGQKKSRHPYIPALNGEVLRTKHDKIYGIQEKYLALLLADNKQTEAHVALHINYN